MTKFAIVAPPDSWVDVMNWMDAHDDVRFHKQLFSRTNHDLMDDLASEGLLIKVGEDPLEFLENKVYNEEAPATGFILEYNQAKSDSWNKIWRYVRKECKIIHFKWRNPVRLYVYYHADGEIDPVFLESWLDKYVAKVKENETLFRYSDVLDVVAEDVMEDRQSTIDGVCDFLKIPRCDQDAEESPIESWIEEIPNYVELKAHFENKPYAEFFP